MYKSNESNKIQAISESDLLFITNETIKNLKPNATKKEIAALITGIREGYAFAIRR